ncbi:PhnD/SsuA/transferrin family substrate-binding protein [Shinella sp. CPCC 101442]|uniref:ABC transporter substrate-binding protein n=1 Tax=Shinella sp. CPCC 101442 TaxID=2932265 RepID=UPI002152481E|nr:PhnD/SsuA/transferrin family substrate-binding protein [Shinella sp. CPCC 101442]MCR6502368.1 PhnD/SsuA/transferrin family substrate-binding protein [Shinella sp. CPCC 101442]
MTPDSSDILRTGTVASPSWARLARTSLFVLSALMVPAAHAQDEKVTIIVGQNGPELQPAWEASGIWKDAPYNLEFATFPNVVENATALAAGKIDIGAIAQFTAIQAQAAANPDWTKDDVPYKSVLVFSTADSENHERFVTVASKDSGITELTADAVRGKRWASSPGATNFLLYLQTLKHLGLTPEDVVPVTLNNEAGALALLNGQVDLVSGPIEFYDQSLADGAKIIAKSGDVGPGSQNSLIASTASLADPAKDAALRDLVARYVAFQDWYNTHPKEAQETLVKVRKLTPESAAFFWAYNRVIPRPITKERIDDARSIAQVVHEFGVIKKTVDVSLAYDSRYTDTIEEKKTSLNFDDNLKKSLASN